MITIVRISAIKVERRARRRERGMGLMRGWRFLRFWWSVVWLQGVWNLGGERGALEFESSWEVFSISFKVPGCYLITVFSSHLEFSRGFIMFSKFYVTITSFYFYLSFISDIFIFNFLIISSSLINFSSIYFLSLSPFSITPPIPSILSLIP